MADEKSETLTPEHLWIDTERVSHRLGNFIKTSVVDFNREGAIVGLSGGMDSSVVLALSAAALGPNKVLGLIMPERDSSQDSEPDARLLAETLGVRVEKVELTSILGEMGIYKHIPRAIFARKKIAGAAVKGGYKLYTRLTGERPFLSGLEGTNFGLLKRANAYYRMKHRLRMVILYSYAERENLLVVGTVNKTEFLTGFFVKYGDSAADITPLLPLYKTQVRQLAEFLHIPERIINKAPSPDLKSGITDEFAIGAPYEKLDLILSGLDTNMAMKDIVAKTGVKQKTVEYVKELVKRSEHMRISPIVPD
ncbi:NH(3)-dependent NAD(+) synthetase [subsurface metagenome]